MKEPPVRRFVQMLLALLAALVLIPFGVANRHAVPVTFDPFSQLNSSFAFDVPLALLLFVAMMVGLLLGGLATWMTQGRWRRTARVKSREAFQWKAEADRLARERDASLSGGSSGLPSTAATLPTTSNDRRGRATARLASR
jgi:uncharacterized integral membrane protein